MSNNYWCLVPVYSFFFQSIDLGNHGTKQHTASWYFLYCGYFFDVISSVRIVEPIKIVVLNNPHPDTNTQLGLLLNKHQLHQIIFSQKKFGCREYANKPVVQNPMLYGFGNSDKLFVCKSLYFLDWNAHCWLSAIASPPKNTRNSSTATVSTHRHGSFVNEQI